MADKFRVNVVRCPAEADAAEVERQVFRCAEPFGDFLASLGKMKAIAIKPNMGLTDIRTHHDKQISFTDRTMLYAVLKLLREHTSADLIITEGTTNSKTPILAEKLGYMPILEAFGARIVETNDPPFIDYPLPNGSMFTNYKLHPVFSEVDALISLAKMKSHLSCGATLTLKNLFGYPPMPLYGEPRRYFHAPIRLSRVVADLGLLLKPTLNIIEGTVGQNGEEWHGEPMAPGVILMGDNTVATDAAGIHLMGNDPTGDYDTPPFHFDRNPLNICVEKGYGTVNLGEIEFTGDVREPVAQFTTKQHNSFEVTDEVRRSSAESGIAYRKRRSEFLDKHRGKYVGLCDGEVVFEADDMTGLGSRGEMMKKAGKPNRGIWIKLVAPEDEEDEVLEVYEGVVSGEG